MGLDKGYLNHEIKSGIMDKIAFEEEFHVDLDSSNLDIVKAVEVGIEIEKRGEKYYFENAEKVHDEELKRFLEFLGKQEIEHFEILGRLKQSLQENNNWIKTDERLEHPEIFQKGKAPEIKKDSEDLEILMHALEVEKQTRDYYKKLADNIDDPSGKHFFETLVNFEQSHADMIQDMMDIRSETHIET